MSFFSGLVLISPAAAFNAPAQAINLVEHFVGRLLVPGIWLEDAVVFKIGKHGEQNWLRTVAICTSAQHQT